MQTPFIAPVGPVFGAGGFYFFIDHRIMITAKAIHFQIGIISAF